MKQKQNPYFTFPFSDDDLTNHGKRFADWKRDPEKKGRLPASLRFLPDDLFPLAVMQDPTMVKGGVWDKIGKEAVAWTRRCILEIMQAEKTDVMRTRIPVRDESWLCGVRISMDISKWYPDPKQVCPASGSLPEWFRLSALDLNQKTESLVKAVNGIMETGFYLRTPDCPSGSRYDPSVAEIGVRIAWTDLHEQKIRQVLEGFSEADRRFHGNI